MLTEPVTLLESVSPLRTELELFIPSLVASRQGLVIGRVRMCFAVAMFTFTCLNTGSDLLGITSKILPIGHWPLGVLTSTTTQVKKHVLKRGKSNKIVIKV